MTSTELSFPSLPDRFAVLVQHAARRLESRAAAKGSPEDARSRRAFVQEMLSRNPGAFSSDLDVQSMMQHYPGSF